MRITKKEAVRFWKKVHKTDGCWLWTGAISNNCYGVFSVKRRWRKHRINLSAHRVSYWLARGKLPANGKMVMHRCDVRNCVNPSHLRSGTAKQNSHDMINKGRQRVGQPKYVPKYTRVAENRREIPRY